MLFYISDTYRSMVKHVRLYRSSLVKIKSPHFVTFYNDIKNEMKEDEIILKLSDAFENETDNPELELRVRVININKGHNQPLMEMCEALKGYMILNEKVVEQLNAGKDLDSAVGIAIKYCINNNILRDVLRQHEREVYSIMSELYTFEDFKRDFAEAYEEDIQIQREELEKSKEKIEQMEDEIKQKDDEIKKLMEEIEKLKKME